MKREPRQSSTDFEIRYTLAFCLTESHVLMLRRIKPPNAGLWNGLGGKLEAGETPVQNIKREIFEEAGIEIEVNEQSYKGILKWNVLEPNIIGGAHLFFFKVMGKNLYKLEGDTEEGYLSWKTTEWITDRNNQQVAENIPFFFYPALETNQPQLYEFNYQKSNNLVSHQIKLL